LNGHKCQPRVTFNQNMHFHHCRFYLVHLTPIFLLLPIIRQVVKQKKILGSATTTVFPCREADYVMDQIFDRTANTRTPTYLLRGENRFFEHFSQTATCIRVRTTDPAPFPRCSRQFFECFRIYCPGNKLQRISSIGLLLHLGGRHAGLPSWAFLSAETFRWFSEIV